MVLIPFRGGYANEKSARDDPPSLRDVRDGEIDNNVQNERIKYPVFETQSLKLGF